MDLHSHIRRLIAIGLLPLLLLTGVVPGLDLFRCRHDGEVRLLSCCSEDEMDESEDVPVSAVSFEELACCEVTHVEFERPSFTPASAHAEVALVPLQLNWQLDLASMASRLGPSIDVLRIPDATGPPIRLKTQTFLN